MLKKIISSIMAVAMLASIGTTVMAEDVDETKDYVVTYSAEEVMDMDTLFNLAVAEAENQRRARSINDNDGQLSVDQLLEIREYSDGRIEKSHVNTTFVAIDESGNAVTANSNLRNSHSAQGGDYNVTAGVNTYYTTAGGYIKVENATCYITKYGTASPTVAEFFYVCAPSSSPSRYSCSTTQSYQTIAWYNSDTNYYNSFGRPLWALQTTVELDNGSYFCVNSMLNA